MKRPEYLRIKRLKPEELDNVDEIWSICRYCGADIPKSRPNMAYCDATCKQRKMSSETGMRL